MYFSTDDSKLLQNLRKPTDYLSGFAHYGIESLVYVNS